jgi:hypothetical protein
MCWGTESGTPHNYRIKLTVRPVTSLAKDASAAPGRPAAYAGRWADEKRREGEGLERSGASPWVAGVVGALVSGAGPTEAAPEQRWVNGGCAALRTSCEWYGAVSGCMYETTGSPDSGLTASVGRWEQVKRRAAEKWVVGFGACQPS